MPAGEYGYLVYMQNGPAVQKRASDIMPGDIVEIHDAKLKGHKGAADVPPKCGWGGRGACRCRWRVRGKEDEDQSVPCESAMSASR